jgi:ComF family protein
MLDGAFALWSYGKVGTVRRIQHQLKYQNRPWLGPELGRLMGQAYAGYCREDGAPEADLIIPVPLSKVRLYERGYNQSAMLGEGVAQWLDCRMDLDVLARPRSTKAQARLGKKERKQNVAGAFTVVRPESVVDRHVVLIDDVMTTGATAIAAAHPLSEAGAASVYLLAMAITG